MQLATERCYDRTRNNAGCSPLFHVSRNQFQFGNMVQNAFFFFLSSTFRGINISSYATLYVLLAVVSTSHSPKGAVGDLEITPRYIIRDALHATHAWLAISGTRFILRTVPGIIETEIHLLIQTTHTRGKTQGTNRSGKGGERACYVTPDLSFN